MSSTAKIGGTFGSGIFSRPKKQRKSTFEDPTNTPLSVIRLVAEKGYLIVTEEYEMTDSSHPEFYQRRWRVKVYDGRDKQKKLLGIGEAPRKSLAKESAATDFLVQLTLERFNLSLPAFKIPKQSRISSAVVNALASLCKRLKCGCPVYRIHSVFVKGNERYEVTVEVDGKEFKEVSYELNYAKFGAAKRAFDSLGNTEFELDGIIMGSDCLSESERDDAFVGSEEFHIVHSKNPVQLGRIFMCDTSNASRSSTPMSSFSGKSGGRKGPASESGSSILSPAPKRMRVCLGVELPKTSVLKKIRMNMLKRKLATL